MALEDEVGDLLAGGDVDGAATRVIELLGPEVLGYLRALLRDHEEVEDVFSAFAENVRKGLPGWRREGGLRAWAYRVAWNAPRQPLEREAGELEALLACPARRARRPARGHPSRRQAQPLRGAMAAVGLRLSAWRP